MKKFKHVLVALVAFFAFTAVSFANPTTANAKTHHSVRTHHSTKKDRKVKYVLTFPKNMRGTWYSYTNFYGKMKSKLVITKHSLKSYTTYDGTHGTVTNTLHKPLTKKQIKNAVKANDGTRYAKYMVGTFVKTAHYKWFKTVSLDLDGDNEPGFTNVHTFNKHVVLTSAAGGTPRQAMHYFRSDKLAKKYAHKKFPHFNYQDVQQ